MFQSQFSKLSLALAGGAVAAVTAMGPATAATSNPAPPQPASDRATTESATPNKGGDHRYYRGKVISKKPLMVRNKPSKKGKIVGKLRPGQKIAIICKVNGDVIDGNPRWYKLPRGGYAWASARYIKNIGPAPHTCHHHR